MVATRTSGNNNITMTQAELDQLITTRIAAALEAAEIRRNAERQRNDQTEGSERSETPNSTRFRPHHHRARPDALKNFLALKPTNYHGTEGPVTLIHWLEECESHFDIVHADERDWVRFATSTLRGDAMSWWKAIQKSMGVAIANSTPWEEFKETICNQYCSQAQREAMEAEFWKLRVKNDDIDAYNTRFLQLCSLCPDAVATERRKIARYIRGLSGSIQTSVTATGKTTLAEVMALAKDLYAQKKDNNSWKNPETKNNDNKRKLTDNTGKSDNRADKKAAIVPSGSSGPKKSNYQGSQPFCSRCEKHHAAGYCGVLCTNCNRKGHIAKNCTIVSPTPITAVKPTNAVPTTSRACYNCGDTGHLANRCPKPKQQKGTAPSRVHALTVTEARNDPNVVTGTFLLNDIYASVLFDTGAVDSFVSTT